MNRCTALMGLIAFLLFAMLLGCARPELSGPPDLRLGRDECAECGMIINEDRFSAAILIEREGVREYASFDDIGCLLDHEHGHGTEFRTIDRFVHDYSTRAWVNANTAYFLLADTERLQTPMGSGIAGTADRAGAEAAAARYGGEVLDFAGLVPARRAWMVARYGAPKEKP